MSDEMTVEQAIANMEAAAALAKRRGVNCSLTPAQTHVLAVGFQDLVAELKAKDETIRGIEGNLFECRERIAKLDAELRIKSEWISTRQCPDHSGKWPRGTCLQCEIERQGSRLGTVEKERTAWRAAFNGLHRALYNLAKDYTREPIEESAVEWRLPEAICPDCKGPLGYEPDDPEQVCQKCFDDFNGLPIDELFDKQESAVEEPLTEAEKFHVEMNDFLAGRDVPADPRNTREVWRDPDGFVKNAPAVEKQLPCGEHAPGGMERNSFGERPVRCLLPLGHAGPHVCGLANWATASEDLGRG